MADSVGKGWIAPGGRPKEHHPILSRVGDRCGIRARDRLIVAVRESLVLLRRREPDNVPPADDVRLAGRNLEALSLRIEVARWVDPEVLLQVGLGESWEVGLERRGDV